MVWLIIGLPAAAVIGGLLTVWIAARDPDSLVAEDYYKQGLAIHQTLEREARARALGLVAEVRSEGHELRVDLHGRVDRYPDRLVLTLVHPSRAEQDRVIDLVGVAAGEYRGTLPSMSPGPRRLILLPQAKDWRLTGRGEVPFSAPLRLEAVAEDSPTHP